MLTKVLTPEDAAIFRSFKDSGTIRLNSRLDANRDAQAMDRCEVQRSYLSPRTRITRDWTSGAWG